MLFTCCYKAQPGQQEKPSRDSNRSPSGNNNSYFYLYRKEIRGNEMKFEDAQCKALFCDFICTDQIIYSF